MTAPHQHYPRFHSQSFLCCIVTCESVCIGKMRRSYEMVFTMRMAGGYVLSPTYHFSEMVNDISRQATTIFELHFPDFSVSIINCVGTICPFFVYIKHDYILHFLSHDPSRCRVWWKFFSTIN